MVPLNAGSVSFTTSPAAGNPTISFSYSGDSNYLLTNGFETVGLIEKDNTTTSVSSSPNPSVFGQAVTFTATVTANSPGSGTPTGTVTFTDMTTSTTLGTAPLSGGTASFTTSALAPGNHTITASYGGGTNFNSSSGTLAGGQTVNQAGTSTNVMSSANPSVSGQSLTYTATVSANSPGGGTPTGSVTFTVAGQTSAPVALNGSGQAVFNIASLSVAPLPAGTYTVTAIYSSDTNFQSSSGSLSQVVNKDGTTTTVLGAPNPSNLGQSVTFTPAVTALAPGSGTPTGTVSFSIDGGPTLVSVSVGVGAILPFPTGGNHTVTATYSGDANFTGSTGTTGQTVNQGTSVTVLTGTPNPSNLGQAVTFTATVTSAGPPGTPSGSVTFKDGAAVLGTQSLNGAGMATFTTASLTPGAHTISAVYSGDTNFTGSTGTFNENVQTLSTTTTLASTPNPSVHNQPVTFTATVASGGATPTGTVTFFDSGQQIGTGTLAAGVATFTTASLTIGAHSITASYSGTSGFLPALRRR
jgi:hypothetical protein